MLEPSESSRIPGLCRNSDPYTRDCRPCRSFVPCNYYRPRIWQRQPLLTFIVAAGGFAGVETIGGINDFVREAIRSYPNLNSSYLRFHLVTPDDVILSELKRTLGVNAQRRLSSRGVEIVTGAAASSFSGGVVELTNGEKIVATTLIWSAGTAPNDLRAKLPLLKRNGRIVVDSILGSTGRQEYEQSETARLWRTRTPVDFIRPRHSTP
jgi:NADH dehydrogenase FAD-containing subunit